MKIKKIPHSSKQSFFEKEFLEKLSPCEEKISGLAEDIFRTLRESILVLDQDFRIITANPSFYQTFKVSPDETLNKYVFQIGNNQWEIPELRKLLTELLPKHKEFHGYEVNHVFKQLGKRSMLLNAKKILRRGEHLILLAIEDITERRQVEVRLAETARKLRKLSIIDELTKLHNRRGFFELGQQQLKLAERLKHKMFLLFIDLNGLKLINDQLGHNVGDQALEQLASILKKTFRISDSIARIGGDEFVVFGMEETVNNSESAVLRLKMNLREYSFKNTYQLSISLGIAHFNPITPSSLKQLLKEADEKMYQDKRSNI